MVVLSRQTGQAVMLGDYLTLMVERILPDRAHVVLSGPAMTIQRITGEVIAGRKNAVTLVLCKNEELSLSPGISISLGLLRADRIRLRIDSPDGLPVHRKEVYDAIKHNGAEE